MKEDISIILCDRQAVIFHAKETVLPGEIKMMKALRRVWNVLFSAVIFWKWTQMIRGSDGSFASHGLKSLKWFTVLSNLLAAVACIAWLILTASDDERKSRLAETIKFVAAVSVALTLVTVMFFLGPVFGYETMFTGPNLWFHLFVPVLAGLEFMLLNREPMHARQQRLATVPMLLYGIGYIGNNAVNGIGEWPHTNDWYAFLSWGWAAGIGIFAAIIAVTRLLASLLAAGNRIFSKLLHVDHA